MRAYPPLMLEGRGDQRGCYLGHDSRLRFPSTSCQVSRSGCLRKASPAQENPALSHMWPQALLWVATHTQDPHSGGPQLDAPRADAGQSEQVGTSRSILGAGGGWGAWATKSKPRGRKAKLRGRGTRRRGQEVQRPGPWLPDRGPSGWGTSCQGH